MTKVETAVGMLAQLVPIISYFVCGYVTGRFWAMSMFRKRLHEIARTRRSANTRRRRENEELTRRNEELWQELRATRPITPAPVNLAESIEQTIRLRRRERRRQAAYAREQARERSTQAAQFRHLELPPS